MSAEKIKKIEDSINSRRDKISNYDLDGFFDRNMSMIIYAVFGFLSWALCDWHFPRIIFGYTLYTIYVSAWVDFLVQILLGLAIAKFVFWLLGRPEDFEEAIETMDD